MSRSAGSAGLELPQEPPQKPREGVDLRPTGEWATDGHPFGESGRGIEPSETTQSFGGESHAPRNHRGGLNHPEHDE